MKLQTNLSTYDINSYSTGLNHVSFDIDGDVMTLKSEFLSVSEATIINDNNVAIAAYNNVSFKSATIYSDDKVTVTLAFPEMSTMEGRVAALESFFGELEEAVAELMFGLNNEEVEP